MRDERLIAGRFQDILPGLPDGSVDAVLTDPPYPRAYIHLWDELARELPRVLAPGGSFVAIVPHYALPEVLAIVGKYLKFRWAIAMWQSGQHHARMAMGIHVLWKPVVWWVNGSWAKGQGFVYDGFESVRPSTKLHEWQQSIEWARAMTKYVPKGGTTVLDPMMGTGTMGLACREMGLNFIGIEADPNTFEMARTRLGEEVVDGVRE